MQRIDLLPQSHFWDQLIALVRRQIFSQEARDTVLIVLPTTAQAQHFQTVLKPTTDGAQILKRVEIVHKQGLESVHDAAQTRLTQIHHLLEQLRSLDNLKAVFRTHSEAQVLDLAASLTQLCEQLSATLLPRHKDAWQRALDPFLQQLNPRLREPLSQEAHLIWQIWQTQTHSVVAQQSRAWLKRAKNLAQTQVIWLSTGRLTPLEQQFLSALTRDPLVVYVNPTATAAARALWRKNLLVTQELPVWLNYDFMNDLDFADTVSVNIATDLFDDSNERSNENLNERSNENSSTPNEVLQFAAIELIQAAHLEDEAQRACQTIVQWRNRGTKNIALVTLDRVIARRITALLARQKIIIIDELGWPLDSSHAATLIHGLLQLHLPQTPLSTLIDVLHHASHYLPNIPWSDIAVLEQLAAKNLTPWRDLPMSASLSKWINQLYTPALTRTHSIADWGNALYQFLEKLALIEPLSSSIDGKACLDSLSSLTRLPNKSSLDLRGFLTHLEWLWHQEFFESNSSVTKTESAKDDRDAMHDSAVHLMSLSGAILPAFDAVLIVGAGVDTLPERASEQGFFSSEVKRELGLFSAHDHLMQQVFNFTCTLMSCAQVVITTRPRNGEKSGGSHWLAWINDAHQHTINSEEPLTPISALNPISTEINKQSATPKMRRATAPKLLPRYLSAQAWQSLQDCPFQFYARYMLELKPAQEAQETPDKREYGIWLHDIFHRWHQAGGSSGSLTLHALAGQVFTEKLALYGEALAYECRFLKLIDVYLEDDVKRRLAGWTFFAAEQTFEKTLHRADGSALISLRGRIDRIDQQKIGSDVATTSVIDYKTQTEQKLREWITNTDKQQLAFYALLLKNDVPGPIDAAYYAMTPTAKKSGWVDAPDIEGLGKALEKLMIHTLDAIANTAPLPAHGTFASCRYCEMRGICRRSL